MARPIRIQYPGAVYHVMARGNQGKRVFDDDEGRGAESAGSERGGIEGTGQGSGGEGGTGVVVAAGDDGIVAVGERTAGAGASHPGEPCERAAGATVGEADAQTEFGIERAMNAKCKLMGDPFTV